MKRKGIKLLSAVCIAGCFFCRSSFAAERKHWNIGDTVNKELDGVSYVFRCIDQDYGDEMGNHLGGALFLCDSVIAADFGSHYAFEETADGGYEYVFYPGAIVHFGDSNEYKTSKIRSWLKEWECSVADAKTIAVGTREAYCGATKKGQYEALNPAHLQGSSIGFQKMTDRLFCLSVEEALRYRSWLWKFDGEGEENPETQCSTYCKGYWLRNLVGTESDYDTDLVYIVDLVNGMIRPERIMPDQEQENVDEELRVTMPVGVRPAFVLPQE